MQTVHAPPPVLRRHAPEVRRRVRHAVVAAVLAATALGALGSAPGAQARGARPAPTACPSALEGKAACYRGATRDGAPYTMAVPAEWNGSLVVHAHGGPDLGATADPQRSADDLERWQVMVREGYAWAGSSYRRGGYGTRMAVEDTDRTRRAFTAAFGTPHRTYLHGQSWGGNIAAKTAETEAGGAYDGVLLTNGVLAGGSRGYDQRVDLRAVYQYYCHNHPRPSEEQYPLWQGLPAGSPLTKADLKARAQECTGYASDPEDRTARQQRALDDILSVTRIPERSLLSHLEFATFTFRDLVSERLGGRNPFGNRGVRYTGSHDDAALNAGVVRFAPDPTARRDLSWDSDLTGRISSPVLTLHAAGDPTAFAEHESAYRDTVRAAGRERHLLQTFTREDEHSGLSDAEYAGSLTALDGWVRSGRKPDAEAVASACRTADRTYGTGCFHDTGFRPAPYASRVRPRPGGLHWPAMTAAQERAWGRAEGVGISP